MAITTALRTDVTELYVALFGRAPDADGLGYWCNQVDTGVLTVSGVALAMYNTDPARAYYPLFLTNEEFIGRVYTNVLGRTADADGLAYWTGRVNSIGKVGALQEMIDAVNNYAGTDPAGVASKALFQNKVVVAEYYAVNTTDGVTNATAAISAVTATSDVSTPAAIEALISAGGGAAGQTFTLTSGIDSVTGTTGNDTIVGNENSLGAATLTGLDSIDGGAGTDTLNVADTDAVTIPASATVKNVENANITSAATVNGDVSGWTGLTALKVVEVGGTTATGITAAGTTAVTLSDSALAAGAIVINGGSTVAVTSTSTSTGTITIGGTTAPVGAVTVNATVKGADAVVQGAIKVTGGTTVDVTTAAANAVNTTNTQADVTVTGGASTTTVTVSQDKAATAAAAVVGKVNGKVVVNDVNAASATAAGTITTVTLNSFGDSTIDSSALTTVNLSGTGTKLDISRGALTATPTANTLALNVNGLTTTGAITDAEAAAPDDGFTTLNITTAGTASTIASLVAADATALNVAGSAALTLTANTLAALKTATVSGAAGLSADLSASAALTSVTSTSTGNNTLTLANTALTVTTAGGTDAVTFTGAIAATAKVDLGAGNDSLKIAAASTKGATITGGDGTDTLVVGDGDFIDGNVTYTSFETADISGAAAGTLNMTNLASATALQASAAFSNTAITNVAAGTNLTFSNTSAALATTGTLSYALKTDTTADTLTVNLTTVDTAANAAAGKGDDTVNGITVTDLTANDIETLTINTSVTNVDDGNKASDYVQTVTNLTASDLTTLVYTGNASLTITDIDGEANLTKVDASAATGKLNVWIGDTDGAGADVFAGTKAVAILGGSAADTITMTGNTIANNIIVGNGGADVITLAAGGTKETVRYAADTDSVLTLTDTTTPPVTPVVYDTATGYDSITNFTTGEDKIELSSALGLATGDARTAIAGKGTIGDNSVTNAELAAALQTLIGTGVDFFNDGAADRAVAQVIVNDATDAAIVFVDVNADGNFTNGTDGAIYLVGAITGVVISDIVFG